MRTAIPHYTVHSYINVFVKCFIDQNQENEKALRIDIEDNGSGIPESEQENVLKKFLATTSSQGGEFGKLVKSFFIDFS